MIQFNSDFGSAGSHLEILNYKVEVSTISTLSDVVDWRLCLGCGACAYICPEDKVSLYDFLDEGIRPVLRSDDCSGCTLCVEVCPGVQSDFRFDAPPPSPSEFAGDFAKEWGPVVAMWEGHAADPDFRFKGSSGGVLTALAAYCQEVEGMYGTLQITQNPDDPVTNYTRLSRSRQELLSATGSRYSPASVCNGLGLVEEAPAPCVVIGKPSEIAALRNASRLRPQLEKNVGVSLTFFCAETPSTRGTTDLVREMGADPDALSSLRYRGLGWPGFFAPIRKGETEPAATMTYSESWEVLQAYRPWAIQLWPDGSGELADISCGDPWYEQPDGQNPGGSLVVARTERGRKIVEGAIESGYLQLTAAEAWKLEKSQGGLLKRRGAVWGRRLASKMCGLPITRLPGLDLRHAWRALSFKEKVKATFGTIRRLIARGLYRPSRLDISQARPVTEPQPGTPETS